MISWFRRIWGAIVGWLTGKQKRHTAFTGVVFLAADVDPAGELRQRKLVLIGSREKAKWLRFECPCKCGEVIALNLMASHTPRWSVELHDDGTVTVHPSVDATNCRSHFWIRRSRIDWV